MSDSPRNRLPPNHRVHHCIDVNVGQKVHGCLTSLHAKRLARCLQVDTRDQEMRASVGQEFPCACPELRDPPGSLLVLPLVSKRHHTHALSSFGHPRIRRHKALPDGELWHDPLECGGESHSNQQSRRRKEKEIRSVSSPKPRDPDVESSESNEVGKPRRPLNACQRSAGDESNEKNSLVGSSHSTWSTCPA